MNIKKFPYWLIGGFLFGIMGTAIFLIFPEKFYGNEVPWYLAWLSLIAFLIFAPIATIFRIDWVSEAASSKDIVIGSVISCFSFFVTIFIIGALVTIIVRKVKNKTYVDT